MLLRILVALVSVLSSEAITVSSRHRCLTRPVRTTADCHALYDTCRTTFKYARFDFKGSCSSIEKGHPYACCYHPLQLIMTQWPNKI